MNSSNTLDRGSFAICWNMTAVCFHKSTSMPMTPTLEADTNNSKNIQTNRQKAE